MRRLAECAKVDVDDEARISGDLKLEFTVFLVVALAAVIRLLLVLVLACGSLSVLDCVAVAADSSN